MEGSGEKGEHSLIEKLMDTKETQQGELRLKIVGVMYFIYVYPLICMRIHIVLCIFILCITHKILHILFLMHIL